MKRAFTFIELLVLTGIITIFAAILFPALSAKPKSIAACLSNENQLITAANLYSTDNNDHVLPYVSCGPPYCAPSTVWNVDRIWTSRLAPYVSCPIDPETGYPYFPPTAPFACPDWNLTRQQEGADAAGCDGNGAPGSGLAGLLPFNLGPHMRSELYATYFVVFGMCSIPEARSGRPECSLNGGKNPDSSTNFGRDGSTVDLATFAFPGDALYPASAKHYLGRRLSEIVRPSETIMLGDGMIWAPFYSSSQLITTSGCEAAHMHWQHVWGGNFGFADGHTAWLGGDSESYRYVGPDGLWIEKYFTFYE